MALVDLNLVITNHAYEQYCDRVESLERDELMRLCNEQLTSYDRRVREYVQMGGVWWVFSIQENNLVFVTCYGKTNMDIPAALLWAKQNKDRINLNLGGEVACNG